MQLNKKIREAYFKDIQILVQQPHATTRAKLSRGLMGLQPQAYNQK